MVRGVHLGVEGFGEAEGGAARVVAGDKAGFEFGGVFAGLLLHQAGRGGGEQGAQGLGGVEGEPWPLAFARAAGVLGELVPDQLLVLTDVGVDVSQAQRRGTLGAVDQGLVLGQWLAVGGVEDAGAGVACGFGQGGEGLGAGAVEHGRRAHEPRVATGGGQGEQR